MFAFWYDMVDAFKSATAALVIAGGLAGIVGILLFALLKLRKLSPAAAIITSTFCGCLLMVPVISSFNNLVDARVEGALLDGAKAEIKARRAEARLLQSENEIRALEKEKLENQIAMAKQSIEIEALNDNIKLLENSQLSLQSFEKILELALLQTNLKQTLVRKDKLTAPETGLGIMADYYDDEVLVIITHDITAKFGIDLNAVKIKKLEGNAVAVSGIKAKFIGTSKNIPDTIIKEIRRTNYKRGVVASINVQNRPQDANLADRYAAGYERDFQVKLSEGLELGFMNDAVVQLGQNFIKVMFAPLYNNIRFTDAEPEGALPVIEYFKQELGANQAKKEALQNAIEALDLQNTLLDKKIEKGE